MGTRRNDESFRDGRKQAHGHSSDWQKSLESHILGAFGELAYAKCKGVTWAATVGTFKAPDVDGDQVRTTPYFSGHLLLHKEDSETEPYILVICRAPTFIISGWLWGYEAKKDCWWNDKIDRPCYWVPQSALSGFPIA